MENGTETLIKVRVESSLEDLETAKELLDLKRFDHGLKRKLAAISEKTYFR